MRYGFPVFASHNGRIYSAEQLAQLRLIRRLIDDGFRPAQIVGKTLKELDSLASGCLGDEALVMAHPFSRQAIDRLKAYDLNGLKTLLLQARAGVTLSEYVCNVISPLTSAMGVAWVRNEIGIHHEHLCTGILVSLLSAELLTVSPTPDFPTIVFGTPVDEPHLLGLLMAQCVFADLGANCISLGPQVPVHEIAMTVHACQADIVAVSFSFAYPKRLVRPWLSKLQGLLPPGKVIWAGGAGAAGIRRKLPDVRIFSDLVLAGQHLEQFVCGRSADVAQCP
ncbi:MAG: MerR family transcriptional regulator [Azonexaceae bacterium]|nr:MerR family transcriptional regulator [Azonexaceae bacterium]